MADQDSSPPRDPRKGKRVLSSSPDPPQSPKRQRTTPFGPGEPPANIANLRSPDMAGASPELKANFKLIVLQLLQEEVTSLLREQQQLPPAAANRDQDSPSSERRALLGKIPVQQDEPLFPDEWHQRTTVRHQQSPSPAAGRNPPSSSTGKSRQESSRPTPSELAIREVAKGRRATYLPELQVQPYRPLAPPPPPSFTLNPVPSVTVPQQPPSLKVNPYWAAAGTYAGHSASSIPVLNTQLAPPNIDFSLNPDSAVDQLSVNAGMRELVHQSLHSYMGQYYGGYSNVVQLAEQQEPSIPNQIAAATGDRPSPSTPTNRGSDKVNLNLGLSSGDDTQNDPARNQTKRGSENVNLNLSLSCGDRTQKDPTGNQLD